jgi:hypothetical protein
VSFILFPKAFKHMSILTFTRNPLALFLLRIQPQPARRRALLTSFLASVKPDEKSLDDEVLCRLNSVLNLATQDPNGLKSLKAAVAASPVVWKHQEATNNQLDTAFHSTDPEEIRQDVERIVSGIPKSVLYAEPAVVCQEFFEALGIEKEGL